MSHTRSSAAALRWPSQSVSDLSRVVAFRDVGFDGLAAEGLRRGHVDARGCLGVDPFVGAHDALRGAAPQGLGVLGDGVNG